MNSAVVMDTERRTRVPRTFHRQSIAVPQSKLSQRHNDAGNQIRPTQLLSDTSRLSREHVSERLHYVLVSISRGLLQYASQCAPWTPVGEADRSAQLRRLADKQQDSIQQLCDVLIERRDAIDWGVFPAEYTSYNHVSLDFLWPKITVLQTKLVRLLEAVRDELHNDTQATALLNNILQTERDILTDLTANGSTETPPVSIVHRQTDRVVKPRRQKTGEVSAV